MTTPKQVSVREFRARLPTLLREVQQGATLTVTSRGKPVAQVGPPVPPAGEPRRFGTMAGRIWIAPDFDDTPDEIIDAMEGRFDDDNDADPR